MSPAAACAEARRRLGNRTALQEAYREQRRLPFLDTLAQDLSYAMRQLWRSPAFAAAAILTLALGIGANVAIYQALHAVLFRDLPVADPARLVQIQLLEDGSPVHVSYPLFRELSQQQQTLAGVFAVSDFPLRQAVLRGRGELRGVQGSLVSGAYFRLLGVPARAGRMLRDEDDRAGAAPVAVLSDAFWTREFDRSPAAIGRVLRINNTIATVVGVAPPGFFGETAGSAPDVWLPISLQPQVMPGDWLNAPSSSWLSVLGRLRPGTSLRQAQAALDPLYRRLTSLTVTRPGKTYTVRLQPANRGIGELEERFGRPLWLLQGIAGLALLIACGNLAGLLLARATARTGEIGVRLALGAGRSRLIRQLLTESLLLGMLGTAAAIPLAARGTRALIAMASAETWRLPVHFGWNAFAFTLALAAVATCLFGLAPALAATRLDLQSALQAGRSAAAGARTRLTRGLIVAQVAISLVLLAGASLFAQSLWNLRHQDFGFDAAQVIAADLPVEFAPAMMRRHTALRGPLFDAATALPGVRSAAVSSFGLLGSMQHTVTASTPERPMGKDDFVRMVHVSERYFETLGIPILAGRGITVEDREKSPPVVVLSQTAVNLFFGGANPVGRYLSTDREYNAQSARLVVGVAHDVRFASARDPFGAVLYVPLAQDPAPVTAILVRPDRDSRAAAGLPTGRHRARRSQPAGGRGPPARTDPRRRAGQREDPGDPLHQFRTARPGSDLHRGLRRDRVCGAAAHARNRRADRARRRAARCDPAAPGGSAPPARCGTCDRRGGSLFRHSRAARIALRHRRVGSHHAGRRGPDAGRGRTARRLAARAPRRPPGSDGRLAPGITRNNVFWSACVHPYSPSPPCWRLRHSPPSPPTSSFATGRSSP